MSTSGRGAVIDSMDTTTDPSPGSQGAEPPPSPGPRDEAGAADEGTRPRTRHTDITHGHLEVWTQATNTTDTNSDSRDDKARKAKEDT